MASLKNRRIWIPRVGVLLFFMVAMSTWPVDGIRMKREDKVTTLDVTEPPVTEAPTEITAAPAVLPVSDKVPELGIQTTPEFRQEGLKIHNYLRKLHGVPDLVLNDTLNEFSQNYANKLAKLGVDGFGHNPEIKKLAYGENLGYVSSTEKSETVDANQTIAAWYAEIENYDFNTGKGIGGKVYTHFTQVVWKATTQMGISYAQSGLDEEDFYTVFVVANYYPRGNFGNDTVFTINVPRLLAGKETGNEKENKSSAIKAGLGLAIGCTTISYMFLKFF